MGPAVLQLPRDMKIKAYYSSDKSKVLEVEPTDYVKTVKKTMIEHYPPPEWADQAVLYHRGENGERVSDFAGNKTKLADYGVQDGTPLRFAYAKKLDTLQKVNLSLQGEEMPEFQVPAMQVCSY